MTRREWLAAATGAAALKAAEAGSVSFERIDTHMHVHRGAPVLLVSMEKSGWRGLSICDSRAVGDQSSDLAEMIDGTAAVHRESKGRLGWATTFDARGFESPGFAERVIAALQRDFKRDALAVKVWKNIGMAIRAKSGAYLLPDTPALLPIYKAIQKAGKTLIAHLAEPDAAWLPLDSGSAESGYYKRNPDWHMYARPEVPAKETILASRDRLLSRFRKLRIVGCHLGSNEENLEQLAKRLDSFPNFAVDAASRVRYLMAGDHDKVRQFLLKYQDRILYGTDFTLGAGDEARSAKSLQATHDREWKYFATAETSAFRDRQVQGLALPESVLRKIFRDNAERWLPGIAA